MELQLFELEGIWEKNWNNSTTISANCQDFGSASF
jgi:hypothetical protein